jgi:hypothetical protein
VLAYTQRLARTVARCAGRRVVFVGDSLVRSMFDTLRFSFGLLPDAQHLVAVDLAATRPGDVTTRTLAVRSVSAVLRAARVDHLPGVTAAQPPMHDPLAPAASAALFEYQYDAFLALHERFDRFVTEAGERRYKVALFPHVPLGSSLTYQALAHDVGSEVACGVRAPAMLVPLSQHPFRGPHIGLDAVRARQVLPDTIILSTYAHWDFVENEYAVHDDGGRMRDHGDMLQVFNLTMRNLASFFRHVHYKGRLIIIPSMPRHELPSDERLMMQFPSDEQQQSAQQTGSSADYAAVMRRAFADEYPQARILDTSAMAAPRIDAHPFRRRRGKFVWDNTHFCAESVMWAVNEILLEEMCTT